jgi:hypothetical protein
MLTGSKVGLRARCEDDIPVPQAELYDDVGNYSRSDDRPWRRTATPPERATPAGRPAAGRVLSCGPRPPPDLQMSTQLTMIKRWPHHVPDRHAARSRSPAGALVKLD